MNDHPNVTGNPQQADEPASTADAAPPRRVITHLIGGDHWQSADETWMDVIEPATGRVYATLAAGGERDVDAAVDAAERAFPSWSSMPADQRASHLSRLADLVEQHLDELAEAESIDTGKPLWLARSVDIPRAVQNLRFFAGAIRHTNTECHDTDGRALNYTLRQPRGVAGCISPWNLPLYLFTWKIAPALATGNTVVAKPSEMTPMTAHRLGELTLDAGWPPGVLNIIHGRGVDAGAAIVRHPRIPAVTFTGGTATGAAIAREAGPMFKKLALELGGKNPTIVFDDVNLDDVVPQIIRAAFANQGQICLCGSRVLVQQSIYEQVVEQFVTRAQNMIVGDPMDPLTKQGAVISADHLAKVRSYIDLAREEGGTVHCGGETPDDLPERCRGGYYLRPAVITGLDQHCRTNQEEIFGPVVTIAPFDDESQAIDAANATPYGLASSVWTNELTRAHRLARAIQTGTVWINCWLLRDLRVPFGGMKQSGVGREGGDEALRFFTEPKNVCIHLDNRD